ncbi:hypothetical protein ABIA69_002715 [Lysinibacillus parviboronicapiens]|uniref:Uncharacterized protein n=1 Tax=Lysinibacillus parviboronicapiens TaxID=436516 RepID=A0ABV2PKS7_9BACI
MVYAEVARVTGLTYDIVEGDVRYIRKFIPGFAESGELKIRELSYYVCYRAEFTDDNKQNKCEQGIRAMQLAIKQDITENLPYENMTFYI